MGTKRGQNEGSVFQRKSDGRWAAQVTLPSGKVATRYAKTKRDAQAKLREVNLRLSEGLEFLDSSQSLEQYLTHWLHDVARETVRPTTYESYASIVRVRVLPHLGKVRLDKLNGQHLQSLYGSLRDGGLSSASVRRTHAVLHSALRHAVKWRYLVRNPADDASPPRSRREEMKTLGVAQLIALVQGAQDTKFRALYSVAGTAGLRRGELCALRWSDLDLDRATVTVNRSVQRIDGQGHVFVEPKTNAGRRKVRLADFAIRELKAHRSDQVQHRLQAGPLWEDMDLVFAAGNGRPMEEATLTRRFKRDLEKAGLPEMRFHDLRHTAATIMMSEGVHPKVVQEALGHSNISVTLDTYSHVTPDMQEAAVTALNARFG